MKGPWFVIVGMALVASRSEAQAQVRVSTGDVSRSARGTADANRLAPRIPSVDADRRARVQVSGDSAQRIALGDFEWKGRVSSVEIDEEDSRVFWDVKIVPDSSDNMIVRYRLDAASG